MKQRTWCALAVAGMLAASAPALRAQDATTPDTSGTTSDVTIPAPVPPVAFTPLNLPTLTVPPQIDYSVLLNKPFTYTDLMQAKYAGLSDSQIAAIGNIADKTGLSFHLIREEVLRGAPFASLATKYGLNLDDVYNTADEEQEIANYKQAYETTGYYAIKAMKMGDMSDNGMASDSSMNAATGTGTAGTGSGMSATTGTGSN